MFSPVRPFAVPFVPLWPFRAGDWNVSNVVVPRFTSNGCRLLASRVEYDITAALRSSLRSAAWTFSVFFTGRDLLR